MEKDGILQVIDPYKERDEGIKKELMRVLRRHKLTANEAISILGDCRGEIEHTIHQAFEW